jgi:aspartate racemase
MILGIVGGIAPGSSVDYYRLLIIVFEGLAARSAIPLISIVESAARGASAIGARTVGLLGTRFTVEGRFYADGFARVGIAVRTASPEDQAYVHGVYMGELVAGDFRAKARAGVLEVGGRLQRAGAEAILLAGTELPLLLRGTGASGIPLLDTTKLHVEAALARMLEDGA